MDCATSSHRLPAHWIGWGWMAIAAAMLAFASRAVHAQDTEAPVMLVAAPQLGGFYRHSVLVAVPIEGKRHVGFIINRPTDVSMARLFPNHEASRKVVAPVYLGGPEMVNSIFAMLRSADSPDAANLVAGPGISVIAEAKTIDRIIEQNPNVARFYAGFVAWQPGELQQELERGFWFVLQPMPELVFRPDVGRLWEELVERSSRVRTHGPQPLATDPPDPAKA